MTLHSLVTSTGLHENTVREHLDGLLARGLVRRYRSEPAGRGRPAWNYEGTEVETDVSEYAGLAAALAAGMERTSPTPAETATAAGEEWGRALVRDRRTARAEPAAPTAATPPEVRAPVLELLADLGFAPEVDPVPTGDIRLTRCPLLEVAERHREVVCGVHLGIVRGALLEHGADPDGTALTPFAEPGACRLLLPALSTSPQ